MRVAVSFPPRRSRRVRPFAAAVLACLVAGCSGSGDTGGLGPPPRHPDGDLDPRVRALLDGLVEAAGKSPRRAEARGQLGLAYSANAIPGAARAAFEQAAALDTTDARWRYHLALAHADEGNLALALVHLDAAIARAPDYAPAHWRRGRWLLDLGRFDEAEAAFERSARLEPDEPAARVGLARVALQRGDAAKALPILERLAREMPGDAHVSQLLAAAYRRTGDLTRAAEVLASSSGPVKADRPDPWRQEEQRYLVGFAAQLEAGIAQLQAGRFAEGIRILESIRADRPNDVSLLANLGSAYCSVRDFDRGCETLEEALRVRPGHVPSLSNLVDAQLARNRPQDALDRVDEALAANPSLGAVHLKRGDVLAWTGRDEDAIAAYDRARDLGYHTVEGLTASGRLKAKRERWSDAAADLRIALEIEPGATPTRALLARALAETGDVRGANAELARAEAGGEGTFQIAKVRTRIREIERVEAR